MLPNIFCTVIRDWYLGFLLFYYYEVRNFRWIYPTWNLIFYRRTYRAHLFFTFSYTIWYTEWFWTCLGKDTRRGKVMIMIVCDLRIQMSTCLKRFDMICWKIIIIYNYYVRSRFQILVKRRMILSMSLHFWIIIFRILILFSTLNALKMWSIYL